MKIIFLNVLNAEITEPLKKFLLAHKSDTDVFCFQEAYGAMDLLIKEVLPDFKEVSASKPSENDEQFTNVTLIRNTFTVEASHSAGAQDTGLCLFTTVRAGQHDIHIGNVHGLPKPGKLDTPNRIAQSKEIIAAFEPLKGIKIIGGDFNVLPETESVGLFEAAGYKNFIKDFKIQTTRNEIVWAKHRGKELYYSDYVFMSGAEAASFEVPKEIVSDHQPMILTIA